MKLSDFSGGISTRLDPTLIGPNEAPVFTNIDNAKGNLTSVKDYLLSGTAINRWFYKFEDVWYSSTNDREYVEYKNKLYWTEQQNGMKKVVNGIEKPVGISAPTGALTAADGGAGAISSSSSELQYMYTYYDSTEGIESAPSPLSNELSLGANKEVDLTGFIPSANIFVDIIRLYRIGADATDFTLLIELPANTTTYTDNIATLDAVGDILDSYNNQPPIVGIRYVIEAYGILFAADGSTLRYTLIGSPDYWSSLNTIPIAGDITGLVAIPDGIVIFINSKAYLLLGTSSDNFRIILLNPEHGCISHNSIKVCKNSLLWVSADGICTLSGSSITVLTKDKLNRKTFSVINAVVYSEQYMLILSDGTVFTVDLRFNNNYVFKILDYYDADIYNLGVFDNVLYAVIKEQLAFLDSGIYVELFYESPRLTEGDASVIKLYNNIYVNIEGRFLFDIYIDGVVVASRELEGTGIYEIKVPQERQRGGDIQFKVQGAGILREIEYKVVGRENGR